MESVSVILIVVGAIIIGMVLLLRLGLRRRGDTGISNVQTDQDDVRSEEAEFDPLFAVDTKVSSDVSERALASVGKIVVEEDPEPELSPPSRSAATDDRDGASLAQVGSPKRRPPRVADDPRIT